MAIFIHKDTPIAIHGITGKEGSFHAALCRKYGSLVTAGITPGKDGEVISGVPVYSNLERALEKGRIEISLVFVPPNYAADCIHEILYHGIKKIVCVTEGVPVHDMAKIKRLALQENAVIIGPNSPGVITSEESKAGIMPGNIFKKGKVGVISRSGTLLYEAADQLVKAGVGVSTALGIGGDPIIGTDYAYWLRLFEEDDETEAVLLIGEIGGSMEEKAARWLKRKMTKPVFAFISGLTAPTGVRMGHAGAIINGESGRADTKIKAFREAGVMVIEQLDLIGAKVQENLGG